MLLCLPAWGLAQGLQLGPAQLQSALGQPLNVVIRVVDTATGDTMEPAAALEPPESYGQLEIPYAPVLRNAKLAVQARQRGQWDVAVGSTEPVQESPIHLLLRVRQADVYVIKEYRLDVLPVAQRTPEVVASAHASAVAVPQSGSALEALSCTHAGAEQAVRQWAAAWAAKDVKAYLSAYGRAFVPEAGQSRTLWQAERVRRIRDKEFIEIELRGLEVTLQGCRAEARFTQAYRSHTLVHTGAKVLQLNNVGSAWVIERERSSP